MIIYSITYSGSDRQELILIRFYTLKCALFTLKNSRKPIFIFEKKKYFTGVFVFELVVFSKKIFFCESVKGAHFNA